jgi:phage/plasmid-associated DNA primase
VVNFNADFRNSGKENLIDELCNKECIEYFIKQGIEGLQRRLKNKKYTINEEMIQTKKKWEQENNSISTFVDDRELPIVNYPIRDVYKDYLQCCKVYDMSPLSIDTFSKQIREVKNLKSEARKVNGQSVRIFLSSSKRTKRSSKK